MMVIDSDYVHWLDPWDALGIFEVPRGHHTILLPRRASYPITLCGRLRSRYHVECFPDDGSIEIYQADLEYCHKNPGFAASCECLEL